MKEGDVSALQITGSHFYEARNRFSEQEFLSAKIK
jgi:hypothetical protein